jgi:adsorption protein B
VGIVFQGIQIHKWSSDWKLNYFLWRDRKGVLAHFLSFIATLIVLHVVVIAAYSALFPDGYRFMSIFKDDKWSTLLIQINLLFFLNRAIQRMIFVRRYYGVFQALVSPIRLIWGNLINFLANLRAIRQVIEQGGNPKRVAWDKTEHVYPTVSERAPGLSVGQILIKNTQLTQAQLEKSLVQRMADEKLGQTLLRLEFVTKYELGQALAEQAGVSFEHIDPFSIPPSTVELVTENIALKYRILPLHLDGENLVVASENKQSPVAIASIERQLGRPIIYQICQAGAVTLGLRFHYQQIASCNPHPFMDTLEGQLSIEQKERILDRYFNQQIQIGDALQQVGLIEPSVFNQVMFEFEPNGNQMLGSFMVERGVISQDVLEQVLSLQAKRQADVRDITQSVLKEGGV